MTASTPQLPWRKSTYSADQGGNCVEAASLAGSVVATYVHRRHLGIGE